MTTKKIFFNQNVVDLGNDKFMAKRKKKPVVFTDEDPQLTVAEEAAVHYESMRAILGGNRSVPQSITDDLDLIRLSRSGVKKSALKSLSSYLGISMDAMSSLLHTSHRNIQRKDDDELLDVYKSEQAIEVAQAVSKGLEVFGSKENLQQWLHSSNIALGGKKPIDLLDTTFGIRMIYRILGRLEHGVYS
jgi:putative toxin-antitoxin system antitoxin component (TIGR02293 family)